MRLRILFLVGCLSPLFPVYALTPLDPSAAVSSLNLLLSQYESRIKQLEAENAVLRNEMVKAGIKIPLSEYSGALVTEVPTVPSIPIVLPQAQTGSSQSGSTLGSGSLGINNTVVLSAEQYGKDVSEFVKKINNDWSAIKDFYKFHSGSRIAGYEFVQSGANDHVFVDIVIGSGTTGIYDMKILYQFEKKEYKRRLIGIFEYNAAYGKYVTRPGGYNPFAGVPRMFVKDPNFSGNVVIPSTVSASGSTVTPPSSVNTGVSIVPSSPSSTSTAEIADILKAYSEKKYLSTISLSNTYLEKNPPTVEVLNVRYRTYFIIGKFTESLSELAQIEKLGGLDRQTACNAQVIATYSKNQALIDKYTNICKK